MEKYPSRSAVARAEDADVEVIQSTRLTALLEMVRAAAAATEPASFLPAIASSCAEMIGAAACDVWFDDEGIERAASFRAPHGSGRREAPNALEPAQVMDVLDEGGLSIIDGWVCVPLPKIDDGTKRAMICVARESVLEPEEVTLVEVAASVAGVGLQAAASGGFDDKARDQFLALLGHDLRSPLSNVRVGAQLARRNMEAGDLDSVRQALKIIENQSGRLLARLEALLDAVAASGGWLIRLEPLDLASVASETVEPYRLAAQEQGLGTRFEVEVHPETPQARGDAAQIGQVVEHLVDNASKYASGGLITLRVMPFKGSVRLDVVDKGPGIRPEDVERVFAPFGRGRNAGDKHGYGLGLYLARNIVRSHGGRLWIDRTSRSGTCMSMTLPVSVEDVAS